MTPSHASVSRSTRAVFCRRLPRATRGVFAAVYNTTSRRESCATTDPLGLRSRERSSRSMKPSLLSERARSLTLTSLLSRARSPLSLSLSLSRVSLSLRRHVRCHCTGQPSHPHVRNETGSSHLTGPIHARTGYSRVALRARTSDPLDLAASTPWLSSLRAHAPSRGQVCTHCGTCTCPRITSRNTCSLRGRHRSPQ